MKQATFAEILNQKMNDCLDESFDLHQQKITTVANTTLSATIGFIPKLSFKNISSHLKYNKQQRLHTHPTEEKISTQETQPAIQDEPKQHIEKPINLYRTGVSISKTELTTDTLLALTTLENMCPGWTTEEIIYEKEVKTFYRVLVKELHPDTSNENQYEKFLLAHQNYELVLKSFKKAA